MSYGKEIKSAVEYLQERLNGFHSDTAIILGSGFGVLAQEIEEARSFSYTEIPGFPASTVQGHSGKLTAGKISGKNVLVMQGRFHFYEGHPIQMLALPVRVLKKLGVQKLIITNAAGAVNKSFSPGNLMLITDHINFSLTNPLIGKNDDEFGPRFIDTSQIYSPQLIDLAKKAAGEHNIPLQEGAYMFMAGPSYETPAEIRMVRFLGADAVGMSTVPEALAAAHAGMQVLGLSYISNMGAGIIQQPLSHEEVLKNMDLVKDHVICLVKEVLRHL